MAEIVVASSVGFCFGVRRAVELAEELAAAPGEGRLLSLGPLLHNPAEVDRLRALGVEPVDGRAPVGQGDRVIVRTHGVPVEELSALRERAGAVHDATCPYVRSAQTLAGRLAKAGYAIVLVGDQGHAEVEAVLSAARAAAPAVDARVVGRAGDLAVDRPADGRPAVGKVAVLAQTTADPARLREVALACLERHVEVRVYNTICASTIARQQEAQVLARGADVVIVVGGRNSANTRRLAELCAALQPRTHLVEGAAEVDPRWLAGARRVAVTAGASTPRSTVDQVAGRLAALGE